MKIFIAGLITIWAFHSTANAMSSKDAEHYVPLEHSEIDSKKFLNECKKENNTYEQAEKLAVLMTEAPNNHENLFTELATSNNKIQRNVAYQALRQLIQDEKNEWMITNLSKFITRPQPEVSPFKLMFLSRKAKIVPQADTPYADSEEFGIGGNWLRNTKIGNNEAEIPEYEIIVVNTIKELFKATDEGKAYIKDDRKINIGIEIIASHCMKEIGCETIQQGNDHSRWAGRFVAELYLDSKNKSFIYRDSIHKHIIKATRYYLDTNQKEFIESCLKKENPLNLPQENILFYRLLLGTKTTPIK